MNKKSILLSAHQPVYLPWLGFFHKLSVADLFVFFDNVPYSRKMFYNRNSILGANGKFQMSVPVKFDSSKAELQKDVLIDNSQKWKSKHWKSIVTSYSKAPYFENYKTQLEEIYENDWYKLADLNYEIMKLMMHFLKIDTKIVKASDYDFKGEKSNLVLDMCQKLNADAYLFGENGKNYADQKSFLDCGVKPIFQKYNHPVYTQKNKNFVSNMSALDILCFHGEKSLDILTSNNLTREEYLYT